MDTLAWVWSLAMGSFGPQAAGSKKPRAAPLAGNLQKPLLRFLVGCLLFLFLTTIRTNPDCSFYEHTADLRREPADKADCSRGLAVHGGNLQVAAGPPRHVWAPGQ